MSYVTGRGLASPQVMHAHDRVEQKIMWKSVRAIG